MSIHHDDEHFDEDRIKRAHEAFFEGRFPGLMDEIERVIASHSDAYRMDAGLFESMAERISARIAELTFERALELAGEKAFDPWDVPRSAAGLFDQMRAMNDAHLARIKIAKEK